MTIPRSFELLKPYQTYYQLCHQPVPDRFFRLKQDLRGLDGPFRGWPV